MKKIRILIIIAIIVAVGLLIVFNEIPDDVSKEEIFQQDVIRQEVILNINYGNDHQETFNVDFYEGITAFDLLNSKEGLILETKVYDIGIFIETIGDKKNGDKGKYWMYYVNGEMPMVSADNMILKVGDKVEFKFEGSSF